MRDGGLLESAVARPFQSAFGEDAYPTIFDKAVALFHSLNSNHPFQDGNKRTAVIALNHFLLANGYWHSISNAGVYEIAKRTASYRERDLSHSDSLDEIKNFLLPWTVRMLDLKRALQGDSPLLELYRNAELSRNRIRRDKRNRLIPAD